MMKKFWCMLLCLCLLMGVLVGCTTPPVGGDAETTEDDGNGGGGASQKPAEKTFEEMNDKEKALYLWNRRVNEDEMTKGEQMAKLSASAEGEMQGLPFVMSIVGTIQMRYDGNEFFYYEDASERVNVNNGQYTTDIVIQNGYADGKMFSYQENDGDGRGVYSSLSAKDYVAYLQEKTEDGKMELTAAMVGEYTLTATEEGGYEVTMSALTAEGMKTLKNTLGDLSTVMGGDLTSVEIDFAVDKALNPTVMEIHCSYEAEEGKDVPTLEMKMEFVKIDELTEWAEVSLAGYHDVGDLRVIDRLERAIKEAKGASTGSLTALESCVFAQGDRVLSENTVTEDVTFSNGKEGYRFAIEDSNDSIVSYENGKVVIKQAGQADQTQDWDKMTAKRFFENRYFVFGDFNAYRVGTAEQKGNDISISLSDVDMSIFSSLFEAAQVSESDAKNVKGTITATVTDGKLVSVRYDVSFQMSDSHTTYDVTYVKQISDVTYEK